MSFGQALAANRPHLVQKGFLTPLIPLSEYAGRRTRVLDAMPPRSLAIFPGNQTHFATPSVFYPFRQDPNLQYLTGFLEPNACLLLYKAGNSSTTSVLFANEKDEFAEKWEGERTGTKLIPETFGVDVSLSSSPVQLRDAIANLLNDVDNIFVDTDPKATVRYGPFFNHEMPQILGRRVVRPVGPLVDPLRLIKSENEIDCMRTAAEISAAAYNQAFKLPFKSEHQLHAYLDFMFKQGGCETDAYLAVVAGGPHALTIHYVRNDDVLRDGELVLVDAGGRYGGYCADISRTWPNNGHFTEPQRDLYEAVLAVEKECIKLCTESSGLTMYDLHRHSVMAMQRELTNAGLALSPTLVSEVYPHSIGHNLGLDVHDGSAPHNAKLKANQVTTIEPGVYVPADDRFPKHFHGIGIRIEDNVAVGKDNYEVLTEDTLKEVEDLER